MAVSPLSCSSILIESRLPRVLLVELFFWDAWIFEISVWVQDAQDAGSRREESGRNTTVSDAGHLFADDGKR